MLDQITAKMIIYKDIITDNEMISDSYDLKEIDGVVYEADCAMIEVGGINVGTSVISEAFYTFDIRGLRLTMLYQQNRHWCQRFR